VLELGEVELDVYQWDRASEITVCRQLRRWRLLLLGLAREIESAVAAMPSLIFDAPRPERDRAMAGEEGKLAPRSLMSQEDPAPTMASRTTSRARVTVGSYSPASPLKVSPRPTQSSMALAPVQMDRKKPKIAATTATIRCPGQLHARIRETVPCRGGPGRIR